MDAAKQPTGEPLLTTADLAARADFTLGGVIVSPSTRALRGPAGAEDVEPRVMQVLVVLAEGAGQVVTRETLFNRCWGGVYVGDDSLNRAVAAVRRTVEAVGGRFEIETIPRTGYRLVVPKREAGGDGLPGEWHFGLSRRSAVVAGGAALAVAAAGLWSVLDGRSADRRFDALIARAEQALKTESFDPPTTRILEEAVRLRPGSARAWGLLAVVRSVLAQQANVTDLSGAVAAAEAAARTALAIDPREPNALLAMFELQGSSLDWIERDRRLRQIIAIDPRNLGAIGELVLMLQAAGLNHESWNWNERALALEPLSQLFLCRRAMKLWIAGRVSQADKVIDQARDLWPADNYPWIVRFMILALSGRPRAAQAMLDPKPDMLRSPKQHEMWQKSLAALDLKTPQSIAQARNACFSAAQVAGEFAGQGVMILSALRDVDAAFEIAEGFLLSRGSIVRHGQPAPKTSGNDATWRINTQWLFTPPCSVMRADPRFLPLCDGVGLIEYWRRRGVRPDYQLAGNQPAGR